MIFALLAVTRILHVSIGYSDTTESAINKAIERLEQTIDAECQTLEIKDIQIRGIFEEAFIVYEIKNKDLNENKNSQEDSI